MKNYTYVFLRFYVFLKIQKNMTFYVFLSCCTRFLEHCTCLYSPAARPHRPL